MPTPSFLSAESPLMKGLYTSFIDGAYADSSPILRANLLSNRPDGSEKVSSAIDDELRRCKEFFFSVAFITEGGLMPFLMTFDEMRKRGVRGRILTTDYRWFTEPAALRRLLALSDVCETRLYRCGPGEGFHTKGYFFADGGEGNCRIILGSSNLTQSALSTNCEWNVRLTAAPEGELPETVRSEFERLWRAPQSKPLTEALIDRYAEERRHLRSTVIIDNPGPGPAKLTPNAMQSAFMESLRKMRKKGAEKALLISATGTGKTYAAAFAAQDMHPRRLLFLVHREQIARQALKSFQRVFGEPACCFGLYSGSERLADAKYVFATVQTMSKEDHLRSFEPDAFDLIIIDEVHRAGAESYLRLMDWFTPAFWLGMTASPDRPDGFDIYKLFDNNIAYEIRLRTAMQENLLCPFHYYGIEDVAVEGAGPLEKKDFALLASDERVRHILLESRYYGASGSRIKALVFCPTIEECRLLSAKFNALGLRTTYLSGANSQEERLSAIRRLTEDGQDDCLDYIFTVDVFNEGVDIPEVNQVIFLRPTQSPIIFIQQLGRGLRKADGKDFVVILDFVGQYENNYLIAVALSGDRSYSKNKMREFVSVGRKCLPGPSSVHFDEVTAERIYRSIDSAKTNRIKLLTESYEALRNKLGRIPKLCEFEEHNAIDVQKFFQNKSIRSYYTFLVKYEEGYTPRLSDAGKEIIDFASSALGNAKRIEEALVLDDILHERSTEELDTALAEELRAIDIEPTELLMESTARVLSGAFYKKFGSRVLIEIDKNGHWHAAKGFRKELKKSPELKAQLLDLVGYMEKHWQDRYSRPLFGTSLCIGETYSYEDACRLLNFPTLMNAQNIGGYIYSKETDTLPVFINYTKPTDAIAYEDRFVSEREIIALSKTKRRPDSVDAERIYRRKPEYRNTKIYLFVRKNKDDSEAKEFYFLGEVDAVGEPEPKELAGGVSVFEIHYRLRHPVEKNLYDYITE
ncbi:MAG: DUF3427 domain-containing protein [Burkholderia sp.]|jgi:superfamily II DNA or RNA helicase/HKD family nuclease